MDEQRPDDEVMDTRDAFRPGSPHFGSQVSPVAEVRRERIGSMSDIVRKLRDPDPNWTESEICDLVLEAADEIEQLRSQLKDTHRMLAVAVSEWKRGHWNSLLESQQLHLSRQWYRESRPLVFPTSGGHECRF